MNAQRKLPLGELERSIEYRFTDITLLDNALTHRSYVNENLSLACKDNERLEFLGDAVLELTITDMLMRKFPDYDEGKLSKLRASVVNEQPLAELARRFRIGDFLLLGRGEEASGGRTKASLLANAFESVVAALFLDGGFDRCAVFICRLFAPLIEEGARAIVYRDFKTAVQEICQIRFREVPRYVLISEAGPDHDKLFETSLVIGEQVVATGRGKNKKEAEQRAAEAALEKFTESAPLRHVREAISDGSPEPPPSQEEG